MLTSNFTDNYGLEANFVEQKEEPMELDISDECDKENYRPEKRKASGDVFISRKEKLMRLEHEMLAVHKEPEADFQPENTENTADSNSQEPRKVWPFIPEPVSAEPIVLKAPEKVYEGTISTDPEEAARQCKICYKILKNRDKLKRHATSHQTKAEAHCPNCGVEIKYRFNLKDHVTKCLEDTMEEFDETRMKQLYPKYSMSLESYRRNPDHKIELPPGFKMDKYGRVSGFDLGLMGQFKFAVPKFDSEFNQEEVLKLVQAGSVGVADADESDCE